MKHQYQIYLLIVTFLVLFIGCEDKESFPEAANESGFPDDVNQILSNNCATSGCHSDVSPQNGLDLTAYKQLFAGSSARPLKTGGAYGGEVVVPFNSEKSLLFQMIKGNTSVQMPYNQSPLSSDQINSIETWIDNGAVDSDGNPPFPNPSYNIYVCNQKGDAISVIDGDAKVVSRVFETDFSDALDSPHMAKVFGDYLYVTFISAGLFVKYDKETGQNLGQVEQLEFPGMIMINSDGSKAFVSRSSSAPGSYNTIYSIDLMNMTLSDEILLPVSGIPHGIALSSDDKLLYVANLTANRISIVNAETEEWVEDFVLSQDADQEPMQTALSPDDNYLYISGRKTGNLLVFDTQQKEIVEVLNVGTGPMHIAVSKDGSKIYVPSMMANTVSFVEYDGTSWSIVNTVTHPAFQQLHGCVLSPDDNYLYVSSRNSSGNFEPAYPVSGESGIGNIGIINTANAQVEKILEIETYGAGMAAN